MSPPKQFITALQALMREHGVRQIYATSSGTVCVQMATGEESDFYDLTPDEITEADPQDFV